MITIPPWMAHGTMSCTHGSESQAGLGAVQICSFAYSPGAQGRVLAACHRVRSAMRTHFLLLAALSHAFAPSGRAMRGPHRLESTKAAAPSSLPTTNATAVIPLKSVQDLVAQIERSRDEDSPLMLVKYFAKYCRACRAVAPRYQKLAAQLGEKAVCFEMEQDYWRVRARRNVKHAEGGGKGGRGGGGGG